MKVYGTLLTLLALLYLSCTFPPGVVAVESKPAPATVEKVDAQSQGPPEEKSAQPEESPPEEAALEEGGAEGDSDETSALPEVDTWALLPSSTEEVGALDRYWLDKVDGILSAEGDLESVDALYDTLNRAFDRHSAFFAQSISRRESDGEWFSKSAEALAAPGYNPPQTRQELFETLQTIYEQRLRLQRYASHEAREDFTGTGVEGVKEFKRELTFLRQTVQYRIRSLPRLFSHLFNELLIAPLPTIGALLQIIVAFVIFGYWRRWAADGFYRLRQRLTGSESRNRIKVPLAKVLWYLDQVKSPVGWFVLVMTLFSLVEDPELTFFVEVAAITSFWVLISWLGVRFLNALISRQLRNVKGESGTLLLRSLQWFGIWLVVTGLNLDLISRYIGEGTLHAWVKTVNELLFLLLCGVLLRKWQPVIRRRLSCDPRQNALTVLILKHDKGLPGYLYSILGVGFLLMRYISKRLIDLFAYFSTGQQVLDSMLDLEISKASQQQKEDSDLTPLKRELTEQLLWTSHEAVPNIGGTVLDKIQQRVDRGPGGSLILIGEDGSGKSVLMEQIAASAKRKALLVKCPREGMPGLVAALADNLNLNGQPGLQEVFDELQRQEIKVLLIDDLHLLIRPYIGGQEALDQLAQVYEQMPDLLCICSSNAITWQYVLRARGQKIFERRPLRLTPWTAEQISSLVSSVSKAAELLPDYTEVIIPRQFDVGHYETPEERAFGGFMRVLHTASTGNPGVALGLWTESLMLRPDGRVVVRLPRLPSSEVLDKAHLTLLLVLRVICQTEVVSRSDLLKSLQIDDEEIRRALILAVHHCWVERLEGDYYRLNWYWRKTVVRVLARQNLLTRPV